MAEVRVTDFRMAGFMASRGAKFLGTEVQSGKKVVVFIFSGESNNGCPSAKELLSAYPGSGEERYDAACRSMQAMVRMALENDSGKET